MIARRILGVTLIAGAIVTALYWWIYFTSGGVRLTDERWYTAFEDAFPAADAWMALCMAGAGTGLLMNRVWAQPIGLMAASALIYLAAMDISFNVNNGLYPIAFAGGLSMIAELFMNVTSALLGVWTLVACWPRPKQG